MASLLRRYRPFAVAVLTVTVLVFFVPDGDDGGGAVTARGPRATDRVAAEVSPGAVTGGDASGVASPGAAQQTARAAGGPARAASGAAAAALPAVELFNSPEALKAPDCDQQRRRMRLPTLYSPPCAIPWPKGSDNGGATAQGVTKDEITVVMRLTAGQGGIPETRDVPAVYADNMAPFERGVRLWGRKVKVVYFQPSGNDEVAQRADAVDVALKKPFLVLSQPDVGAVFEAEVAKRGAIMLGFHVTPDIGTAQAPYRWGFTSDLWGLMKFIGEWVGKGLAGRPARWAGDPVMQTQPRKFGVVLHDKLDRNVLLNELAARGVKPATIITYNSDNAAAGILGDPTRSQEQAPLIASRLKEAGVTTPILFTDLFMTQAISTQATNQRYFPEWLSSGYQYSWALAVAGNYDPNQWSHAFGVDVLSPRGPLTDAERFYEWYWGNSDNWDVQAGALLNVLYMGLDHAGPNLTPATFRDALFNFPRSGGVFCNCTASAAISFGRGLYPWDDYTALDDFAMLYWDGTARGRNYALDQEVVGNPRYIYGAKRFVVGGIPSEEPPMFNADNTVVDYADFPASDRLPDYPCEDCPSQG